MAKKLQSKTSSKGFKQTIVDEGPENLTRTQWKRKTDPLREQGHYVQPYPHSMIRKFWETNINPITGMPVGGGFAIHDVENNLI